MNGQRLKFSSYLKSRSAAFMHDLLMVPLAWFGAYWFRFNLHGIPDTYLQQAIKVLPLLMLVQVGVFTYFGLYRGIWRFASIPDVVRIIKAVLTGTAITALLLFFITRMDGMPRSVFPFYAVILILALSGPRLIYRWRKDRHLYTNPAEGVLIVGAGGAGETLARDLLRDPTGSYVPIGFVDDDPQKTGKEIHGVRVLGVCQSLPDLAEQHAVSRVFIATPTASSTEMQRIVGLCEASGLPFRTLPPVQDLFADRPTLEALREVSIEDLLGRESVSLDWEAIGAGINGRSILVTGGGGSIGSELCRQIMRLGPSQLTIFDSCEFNLFQIERELQGSRGDLQLRSILGDVSDLSAVKRVVQECEPDICFHAAAYKHVPLLQNQAREAVRVNVLGTRNVAQTCQQAGVGAFVLISTDKAVNPANVMGVSKRVAEVVCQNLSAASKTRFITVRFGNVLDSAGSVVPIFREQIARGGPVTVTHPDIKRYFMTIPEACQLILQAGTVGRGGEIFVLDMGEPVRINYLAEQMILLSGRQPYRGIEIVYTGLRPGEKLYEELFHPEEKLQETNYSKLLLAAYRSVDAQFLRDTLAGLEAAVATFDEKEIRRLLTSVVPETVKSIDLEASVGNE